MVTEPLQKYAKLTGKDGDLENHASTSYHKKSEIDGKSFISIFRNPQQEVRNRLSEYRKAQVLENRSRLIPIIKTVVLHGRQNIPLRGHRDDGSLHETSEDPVQNDGNFRSLLRFRIDSGDDKLENHLKSAKSNATYISKTTTNELIRCCGEDVLEVIKQRVTEAKYYSVIFDETTDISHTSQLSLSLRYVHDNDVREDFVGFLDLHKANYSNMDTDCEPIITGVILGRSVLKFMGDLGLNIDKCVGIGCDGCSVNISDIRGAASEIQKQAIHSCLCVCKSHALNLSISKCSKVQSVRNAIGCIKEIASFFNMSAKRNYVLKEVLGHQMRGYCETRWVERHVSILEFQEDLPKIAQALQIVSGWDDNTTAAKANCLLHSISNCDFIITIFSLSDILSATVVLSKYLQVENVDICRAKEKITQAIEVLKEKREKCSEFFSMIFENAKKIMEVMDVSIRLPRLTTRQTNRPNYPTSSSDVQENIVSNWEKSVYIPILDFINLDLKDRFAEDSIKCYSLNFLVPTNLDAVSDLQKLKTNIEPICDKYYTLFSQNRDTMVMKVLNEVCSIKKSADYEQLKRVNIAIQAYANCDAKSYPFIKSLLQILLTLPISTATAERSFSTLKRLKTWMRSRMTEDRLTGLALLYVHRDININIENVINRFGSLRNRKLEFIV